MTNKQVKPGQIYSLGMLGRTTQYRVLGPKNSSDPKKAWDLIDVKTESPSWEYEESLLSHSYTLVAEAPVETPVESAFEGFKVTRESCLLNAASVLLKLEAVDAGSNHPLWKVYESWVELAEVAS